jgi:bifunctional DNA-binding transcriptional regulator/antitoxin component of YhaV-PrlF toxin-antitoxin module
MFTGKQFLLTIPKELVELLGWSKDTEVVISKYPGKDILYIEKMPRKKSLKEGKNI